ncbi:TonB-dependent receptor domain-containing protein [Sphingomonas sp.]|uniref:TonB-dependent receptor domain-containing protein n=1 Tax=Sphingomonas sp. TaxID=28214 RepID=UPI002E156673|nr:TonB-dependent receptor [Sphingomonas sp.]
MVSNVRRRLLTSTLLIGGIVASPAFAQTEEAPAEGEAIVITGSRIVRPNLEANSPVTSVTGLETTQNADVTLDTFLNTLPQVNPAGTTTSNNPGNGGQSNIDLRGLGANRNLVLVDGRRPMVSASNQTVDLNTIPQGLIERIDVLTGGAGAAYGADAIAGVVNIILKDDFEGVDLRANYSNSIPETDAREYQISGTIGGNFADNRGNFALSVEYAERQGLIKAQRAFAAQATSTTGSFPTGSLVNSASNPYSQATVNSIFTAYGVPTAQLPRTNQLAFNSDGTLFGVGTFNSPVDVTNFRYSLSSPANPNLNYFPDFYSYNFDIVNILVLPLERYSAFTRGNYKVNDAFEFFVQGAYTNYNSATALAPTPVSTGIVNTTSTASGLNARSALVAPGQRITGFVVPVTNPFLQASADLRALVNSRTGDDPLLTGSGAAEGVRIGYRFLGTGLREQQTENEVIQGMAGLRGEFAPNWRYEAYYSWGKTVIDQRATGNVNVQRVQELLEAPDGGVSLCAGGFNPFGIQPFSQACVDFVDEVGVTKTTFTQKIAQAYITGQLAELPAGPLSVVFGAEKRDFRYEFDPGALFGPIAGFNTGTPDLGTNSFLDFFGEASIPILKDSPWAENLELTLSARHSKSDFNDIQNGVDGSPSNDWSYGGTLTWSPVRELRFRASYQHSVRAPNFGELFSGGGSFPQIFDPCSNNSNFRATRGAAAATICQATGVSGATINSFVATPGAQAFITVTGNPNLKPEKSDAFTAGFVFNALGFTGSIDYYNIKVNDTIFSPDVNEIIASCYGYNEINPNLNAANPYCGGLFRSNNNIAAIFLPEALGGDPTTGYFQAINQGSVKTSGIDFQLGYNLPTEFVGPESSINFNLLLNYLFDFKVTGLGGLQTDYAGTASYFGAGLGTSFPEWKGTMNVGFNLNKGLSLQSRVRYIDAMENRAARQYIGETFTGPGSVWYFDFAVQGQVENMTLRLGLNNAFDRKPPTYAPNVQSGTDPSTYDVIGRRAYVSARLKF